MHHADFILQTPPSPQFQWQLVFLLAVNNGVNAWRYSLPVFCRLFPKFCLLLAAFGANLLHNWWCILLVVHFVAQNLLQEPDAYEIPATVYDFVASLCLRSLCLRSLCLHSSCLAVAAICLACSDEMALVLVVWNQTFSFSKSHTWRRTTLQRTT